MLGLRIDKGDLFERFEENDSARDGDLFVRTDGISEAMNEADDCFGDGGWAASRSTPIRLRGAARVLPRIAAPRAPHPSTMT